MISREELKEHMMNVTAKELNEMEKVIGNDFPTGLLLTMFGSCITIRLLSELFGEEENNGCDKVRDREGDPVISE